MKKPIEIVVYGAEQICASCVHLPSSKDTFEWLTAALKRKFPNQSFRMTYVDIYDPPEDKEKKSFASRVIEEDLFYPVVLVEGKIVGEGNPRLKAICEEFEKYGYKAR